MATIPLMTYSAAKHVLTGISASVRNATAAPMARSRHWITQRAKLVTPTVLGSTVYARCVRVGKLRVHHEQGVFPAHLDSPAPAASANNAPLALNLAINWISARRALRRMPAQGCCVQCVDQALSQTKISLRVCRARQLLLARAVHVLSVATVKRPIRLALSANRVSQARLD